jgi:uncharacterized protein YdhG (YjbR/CyaY superfamily)
LTDSRSFSVNTTEGFTDYITAQSVDIQPALRKVYAIFKTIFPDAPECLSFGHPSFGNLVGFEACASNIAIYVGRDILSDLDKAGKLRKYRQNGSVVTSRDAIFFKREIGAEQLVMVSEIAAFVRGT